MTHLATLSAALRRGEAIVAAGALFDMDGTLVDSIPAVEDAWAIWAAERGVPVPPPSMHGKTVHAVVAAAGLALHERESAALRLTQIEARPGQTLAALPGARDLLESLPVGRWGVVTSAALPVALARYRATGLPEPAFRVTGDDVTNGKPAPDPFRKGVDQIRSRGHVGVVVAFEDTAAGATSATDAGCLAIGVLGTESREQLEPSAHIVIDSLETVRAGTSGSELRIRLG